MKLLFVLLVLLFLPQAANAVTLGVEDDGLAAQGVGIVDRARELNAGYARFIVGYNSIPLAAHDQAIADAIAAGLTVQVTVGRGDIGQFRWWVRRYPQVSIWAYHNEPEITATTPCEYRAQYGRAHSLLHVEHPGALLLFGETSPHGGLEFVQRVIACRKTPLRVDGWAVHPYQPRVEPMAVDITSRSIGGGKWLGIGRLPAVRRWLSKRETRRRFSTPDGGTVPFYITEFGYFTRNPPGKNVEILDETAAAWWPRAILQAARVDARVIVAYGLDAQPLNSHWDTSLVASDGTPRPAFAAIADRPRF